MQYKFEKFTRMGSNFTPVISLRRHGSIGVSQGALQRFGMLDGDWYVVLYYDKNENVMAIQPTQSKDDEGAVKLIKRPIKGKGGTVSVSGSVSAKSFFEFYQIPKDETRSFECWWDDSIKMIIIDLKKPKKSEKEKLAV